MAEFADESGDRPGNDFRLRAELEAAGIAVIELAIFRSVPCDVVCAIRGELHGWFFERAPCHWHAKGPGIELAAAEALHAAHAATVLVEGPAGVTSPRECFKGLACGRYRVKDAAGLRALADTICALVERAAAGPSSSGT